MVNRNETSLIFPPRTEMSAADFHMKDGKLTKEKFDRLLEWLGKDREAAALKYEAIRHDLIKFFDRSVGADAEDLADETINRVIEKLPRIIGSYAGDPKYLFFSYAQLARLEYIRKLARRDGGPLPDDTPDPQTSAKAKAEAEEKERRSLCLRECLRKLQPEERRTFLLYYRGGNRIQFEWRRKLAAQMGVSLNALRLQIHRLNERLRACITACSQQV